MSSTPTLNNYLNNYFISNRVLTIKDFRDTTLISPTIALEDTIITYNIDVTTLFCSKCFINLNKRNYSKHLKDKHRELYKSYINNNTLTILNNRISTLDFYGLDELEGIITNNKFLFKELNIRLNGYKCLECLYINLSPKEIRKHYNKEHSTIKQKTNKRASYILDNIPIQTLEGFKDNKKLYFIPKLPNLNNNENRGPILEISTSNRSRSNSLLSSSSNSITSSNILEIQDTTLEAKDLILKEYKEETIIKEKNLINSSTLDTNSKLLNSFITKSNLLRFLKDKDREYLIYLGYSNLIGESNPIEDNINLDLDLIEDLILEYLEDVSSKINNVPLTLRQRLRSSKVNKEDREYKDFIPLESIYTRRTYFKVFSQLLLYIIKVVFISRIYKNSRIEEEIKFYNLIKDIAISKEVKDITKRIINFNYSTINLDENKLELFYIFSSLFINLLKINDYLAVIKDSTLNNPTTIFYYINCLNTKTKEITNLLTIGKLTSIIVYNSRLITIGYYYYRSIIEEEGEDFNLIDDITIEEFITTYLTNRSKNYFEFILTLAPYILALNKESITTTGLIGELRPNLILYNNIEYPINKIKELFNSLYIKLEDILLNKLLGIEKIEDLGLNFNLVNDNDLLNKVGSSILDIEELSSFKYNPYFLERLLTKGTYYNRTLLKGIRGEKLIFKTNKIERFNNYINSFVLYLALTIYLYSGGPLRGTELTTILFKNIETKSRSLLYNKEEGVFTIVTDYYKSKNITRKEKTNIRYIPPNLSRLIIVYILFIIPFKEYINQKIYSLDDYNTPYLLVQDTKVLTTSILSTTLERESSLLFRKGLTLSSYRKIINYIIKTKFNNNNYYSSSEDENNDLIEDIQANRSTKTSYNYYFNIGFNFKGSNNLALISKVKDFSLAYFTYFNLLTKKDIDNNPNLRNTIIEPITKEYYIENNREFNISNSTLEKAIGELYKDNTKGFKNKEQQEGLLEIITNTPILTFINKTSSGKSLLYLLPSYLFKNNLYIIITPRVALSKDLYNRAKELDLNPSTIKDNPSINSNLYFINIEDLNTNSLDTLINIYKGYNRDIYIYIDEVHLFLLERQFRLKLKYFRSILKYKANLVFLSATLPINLLNILEETLEIKGLNKIIRGSSNRENIEYKRIYFKNNKEETIKLNEILKEIEQTDLNLNNKILIFITSKEKGEKIAKLLNIDFIYSSLETKDTILEDFLNNNTKRTIITTSILEVGLDLSSIKYTINLEPIYSLISLIQSSGRIRISGTSYILAREPTKYNIEATRNNILLKNLNNIEDITKFKELDKLYYNLFTIETRCLRIPISLFLDNTIVKCLTSSTTKCSLCLKNTNLLESIKDKEEQELRNNNYNIIKLEEILTNYYNNYCFSCLINPYNISFSYKHSSLSCRSILDNKDLIEYKDRAKQIIIIERRLKLNSACPKCLLPKNICLNLIKKYNIIDNSCFFKDFFYLIIATFYYYKEDIIFLLEDINLEYTLEQFISYLITPITLYTLETIKIIKIISTINIQRFIKELEEFSISDSKSNTSSSTSSNLDIEEDNRLDKENPTSIIEELENITNLEDITNIENTTNSREGSISNLFLDLEIPSLNNPTSSPINLDREELNNSLDSTLYNSSYSLASTFKAYKEKSNNTLEGLSKTRKHYKNISLDIEDKDRGEGTSKKVKN